MRRKSTNIFILATIFTVAFSITANENTAKGRGLNSNFLISVANDYGRKLSTFTMKKIDQDKPYNDDTEFYIMPEESENETSSQHGLERKPYYIENKTAIYLEVEDLI